MAMDGAPDDDCVKLRRELVISERPARNMPNFKDNVFVPIGGLTTIAALTVGLWSFRKGWSRLSQHMMQIRVIAQGVTVTALIASFMSEKNVK